MEGISEFCPCISGDIAAAAYFSHVHPAQGTDDILTGESSIQFLLQDPVDQERDKACKGMCFDPVIPLQINRPCLELGFHDPERFLDLPPAGVDLHYICGIVIEVRAHRIEAVILRFICNRLLVQFEQGVFRDLPIAVKRSLCDSAATRTLVLNGISTLWPFSFFLP